MPTVELVYDGDCPHVEAARAGLRAAFDQAGLAPRWREWRLDDPEAPAHVRGHGSPAILIDGVDVDGAEPSATSRCRVYGTADGTLAGAPEASRIAAALRARSSDPPGAARRWGGVLAVLPGLGLALLPKVACPACWPAYAGVLSAAGLGFLMETAWLLPLTAAFLLVALGALAFRARRRHGYGPLALGLAAAAAVLIGKFAFDSEPATYAGVALLVAASLWNSRPVAKKPGPPCPSCAADAPGAGG